MIANLLNGGPLIWPLRGKLFHPAFVRQRPRSLAWRAIPRKVMLPWDRADPDTQPSVVHHPINPAVYFRITGTTKDSTGAALGSCVVQWFNTADDRLLSETTSDANGLFEFRTAGQPPNAYYLVAYKQGSPDVAGTTVNTLVGT